MTDSRMALEVWVASALGRVRQQLEQRLDRLAELDLMAPDTPVTGKLLRPRLLLSLAAGSQSPAALERAVPLGAAVELIHLASLHHDDVLDNSPHRRRAASARELFGNKVSILFGDALLTAALDLLLRCSSRRMQAAVARAVTATLRGEIAQHTGHRTLELEPAECVRVAGLKTGSLFGLAARLGAMVAEASPEVTVVAYRFGRRLGTAFQLIDDALDYTGTVELLGKAPGSDCRQGIATLPLVCAWRHGGERERRVLEAGFGVDESESFGAVRGLVAGNGSFDQALSAAGRQLQLARELLPSLEMPEREHLIAAYLQEIEERIPHPIDVPPVSARNR